MSKVTVEVSETDALKHCLGIVQQGNVAILCDHDSPLAEVRPLAKPAPAKKRQLGKYAGYIWMADNFNDPDPELEKALYDDSPFP
jgi:hypothetical protein